MMLPCVKPFWRGPWMRADCPDCHAELRVDGPYGETFCRSCCRLFAVEVLP